MYGERMDDLGKWTRPRATFEQFAAFRDERPKEEKWELIDGKLSMMPPPALLHQRIAKNLEHLLTARLREIMPEWAADREIGVHVPEDTHWCPEPDVTVIDVAIEVGQIYAERFYAVAEVLSPNDKVWALDLKRDYYRAHVHCRSILLVEQTRIALELHTRHGDDWKRRDLTDPMAQIVLPDIGLIGTLRDLYKQTPLA
jgi:Uma2 family endonuclease